MVTLGVATYNRTAAFELLTQKKGALERIVEPPF